MMTALLITVSSVAFADNYAYLSIVQTNEQTNYEISKISKITFDESNMVLNLTDGTQQKLPLANLSKMFFQADPTGISTIGTEKSNFSLRNGMLYVEGQQTGNVTIYDMNGRAVCTATAQEAQKGVSVSGLVKGVYIVKVGSQPAKKIMNK
jgi:hypothetical protein